VVIDNPTVGTRYGAETSAPVFREIAQQVLEYLGVPHDQPLKTGKELAAAPKPQPDEDAPSENIADLNAMLDQINNLPADDPLRKQASGGDAGVASTPATTNASASSPPPQQLALADSAPLAKPHIFATLPQKVLAAFSAENSSDTASTSSQPLHAPTVRPAVQTGSNGSVVVDAGRRVAVPSFSGNDLRNVVESAAGIGLRVQPLGSGLAHDQAPAAGTLVPVGTEVVVRFAR
jgi:cell division protein FtsI (penicillin-binding protein 3)